METIMEKWVRRSFKATLTAGVVGLCAANMAHADDTTIVAPNVDSESTSAIGDNSILGGNTLSAPIVAPITGNDVAVAGIGGAINAENVLAVLGILGTAHAGDCGSDDFVEVAPVVRSRTTSTAGDNSIGSANSASVPVVAPITDNKVAVAGIGAAVNGEDVTAVAGVLGEATCGGGGDGGNGGGGNGGGGPYSAQAADDFTTEALPIGGLGGLTNALPLGSLTNALPVGSLTNALPVGSLAGGLPVPTGIVDQVVSMVGLGSLGGLTGGLPGVSSLDDPLGAVTGVADTATTVVDTQTTELAPGTLAETNTAELAASDPVANTLAIGDDTTVVAPTVNSNSASTVGDNSILSGNSLSVPVVAPITGNDVSVAGVGAAVNADSVGVVLGLLGTATALLQ
jgi:hypothetical protein